MTGFAAIADPLPVLWAAKNPFASVYFLVTVGLLVGVLLIAALVLYCIDNWRKRNEARQLESTETLTNFRAMYDRGELTDAEYQRIRDRVAKQMKTEVAASNPSQAEYRPGPQGTETNPGVQETRTDRPELPPPTNAAGPEIS